MSVMLMRIDEAIMPKKRDWVTPADVKPEASMVVDGGVKLLEILCSVGGNRAVPGVKVTGSFKRDSECPAFFICGLWRSNWSLGARGSGKMFIAEKRQSQLCIILACIKFTILIPLDDALEPLELPFALK